ncbi:MAG: T9SS type A sorting domain-containing protein [Candidatus Marinimicrobia bacterium]|nr:T9SS type A sorting domain-containing protein [Candidatus Neomarinimicrobiota bacterium]
MAKPTSILIKLAIVTILLMGSLFAQGVSFTKAPLITIPGQNTDATLGTYFDYSNDSYLSWVNIQDGTYSIYLMQVAMELHEPALVYQSDSLITNLAVNEEGYVYFDRFDGEFWSQHGVGGGTTPILLQDSLNNPSQPAPHGFWLSWVEDGDLLFKDMDDAAMNPIVVDTAECRSPAIFNQRYGTNWEVALIYESGPVDSAQIKYLIMEHDEDDPQIEVISSQYPSRNPTLGSSWGCSYEIFMDGYWHIVINTDPFFPAAADTSSNSGYNLTNPAFYTGYWLVARDIGQDFVVAVSDSFQDDLDVYFLPVWYGNPINISDMPGNDTSPVVTFTWGDSITVFWEHQTETGSELWWAKDKVDPGAINPEPELPQSIMINRVYPSPFNPNTTLEYSLLERGNVQLSIYDIAGRLVFSRSLKHTEPGVHSVSWSGLSSSGRLVQNGVYLMEVRSGHQSATRKVVVLR